MPRLSGTEPTSKRILDITERLVQTRGFNAFSYADIAAALRITKASLHYHFPTKAQLGRALIDRYRAVFGAALAAIDVCTSDPREKLRQYVGLYDSVLNNERMCLCGMLAAEYATLPLPMQQSLILFFDANECWLTAVLEDGYRAGTFKFRETANERARLLLGALEGAMLIARSYGDPPRFQAAAACMLAELGSGSNTKPPRGAARRPRRIRI
jgi:TetR/AcrR family transcriptional regulator, transcriptional repressor for nem operon